MHPDQAIINQMTDLLATVCTEQDSMQTLYCNSTQTILTLVEPQQQITDSNHYISKVVTT